MILCVDIGNTQSVVGLFDGETLSGHWRVSSNAALTSDELMVSVGGLLALGGFAWDAVERVVIASVVPRLTDAWTDTARTATGVEPMIVGPGLKTGMPLCARRVRTVSIASSPGS